LILGFIDFFMIDFLVLSLRYLWDCFAKSLHF
jgi:hypothetical protein